MGCVAFVLCVLLAAASERADAAAESFLLVGLQPSVTVERYCPDGFFDVKAAPARLEWRVGQRVSLRAAPPVMLHLGVPEARWLTQWAPRPRLSIYVGTPEEGEAPRRLWLGSGTALTRDLVDRH